MALLQRLRKSAPSITGDMASTDSSRESVLPPRGPPNLPIPVQDRTVPSWAEGRVNARTDKYTPLRFLFLAGRTFAEITPVDPDHPSPSQIPLRVDSLAQSRQLHRSKFALDESVCHIPVQIFDPLDMFAKLREHAILLLSAQQGRCVRNAMKRHHGIFRHKSARIFRFQCQLHLLAKKKTWIRNAISHLYEIFHCEVSDRICVHLARFLKLGK